MSRFFIIISALFLLSPKAMTVDEFSIWIEEYKMSVSNLVSKQTLDNVFKDIELSERVLELNNKQPEHNLGFWKYFERMINDNRVKTVKKFVEKNKKSLEKIEDKYEVDKEYLVALSAIETDLGRNTGHFNLVKALSTLSFASLKRKDFFRAQLTALIKNIDLEKIPMNVKGSWAGAFGYFQFMPVTFVLYAVDEDNDGKINLFSFKDAYASSANYLKSIGFEYKHPCLIEVSVPNDFNWNRLRSETSLSLSEWKNMGVFPVDSDSFLGFDDLKAELIMPEGHLGPSFLAFNNFNVLKHWNKSNFYVITACELAEEMKGRNRVDRNRFTNRAMKKGTIMLIQEKLMNLGLYDDGVDGIVGDKTRKALRQVQLDIGLPADGYPTKELLSIWNIENEKNN